MLSEDFDKKIREAADHHHPAYDERAWKEMKKMLDQHLPEEEERKRRFLFWWLLPFLLGGAALLLFKPWQKDKEPVTASTAKVEKTKEHINTEKTTGNEEPTGKTDDVPGVRGGTTTPENDKDPLKPGVVKGTEPAKEHKEVSPEQPPISRDIRNIANRNNPQPRKQKQGTSGQPAVQVSKEPTAKKKVTDPADNTVPVSEPGKNDPPREIVNNNTTIAEKEKTGINPPANKDANPVQPVPANDTAAAAVVATADKKQEEAKPPVKEKASTKKSAKSFFFIGLSGGADVSVVSGNKTGSVKPVTGIGLGYTFKEKFTLRTGFYRARKIYTADGDSYKPSPEFSQYYPYLVNVDANCMVYEIPVSLSYHFGKKTHSGWFASGGLSTLLMKSEAYSYDYKYTPNGNIYTRNWTIKNENKHYFSVATISAGYTRSIGKKFLVMAEPYVKLPLGGVGFGKVKLNSGGVLFTVGYKPFGK